MKDRKDEKVPEYASASIRRYRHLNGLLIGSTPDEMSAETFQNIKNNPNLFSAHVLAVFKMFRSDPISVPLILKEMQRFYREVFKIQKYFSALPVPKAPIGMDVPINFPLPIVAQLTIDEVYSAMKVQFRLFHTQNFVLGDNSLNSLRSPLDEKEDYIILCRFLAETDKRLRRNPAKAFRLNGIDTMTLKERLIFGLYYYWKTGERIDVETRTLCPTSVQRELGALAVVDNRSIELLNDEAQSKDLGARRVVRCSNGGDTVPYKEF